MKGRGKAFFIILAIFSALFFISNFLYAATYNECTTLNPSGTQKISDEAKEIGTAYAASNLCTGKGWRTGLTGKTISLGVNTYDSNTLIGDLIRVDLTYPYNTLGFAPTTTQGAVHSWGCTGTYSCGDSWADQCPSTNCCPPDYIGPYNCLQCLSGNWQDLVKSSSSNISNCPYLNDPNYIMVGGYTTRSNYDIECNLYLARNGACRVVNDECGDTTPELRPNHKMSQKIYFVKVSEIRPTATVYNQTATAPEPQWCSSKNITDVTITNLQTSLAQTNTYRPEGDPLPAAYTNYNPYTIPNYVPLTANDYTQKTPACSAKPEPIACNAQGSTETCDGTDNNKDGASDETCIGSGNNKQCISNNLQVGSTANIASGNLYHSQQIAGITLSYNSMDIMPDPANLLWPKPLGKGWTHNFNILMMPTGSSDKLSHKETDGKITYLRLADSKYIAEEQSNNYTETTKNPDNTYTQTTKDQMTYQYDGTGKLLTIKDPNGKTTTLTYDSNGRLYKITDQNGRITNIITGSYKIATIKDPKGNMYTLTYTGEFLTQIKDPLNNTWQFTYDAAGKMLTKKDPGGYITTYTYDANGKLLTTTDPNGKTKTITYDQANNQAAYTEKDGGTWAQTYDPLLNLPLEKTDPYAGKTRYQYDSHGNITKQQILNASNQILSETNYTYDANGNMLTKTDALGSTTTYTYNALNKITSAKTLNSQLITLNSVKYEYDSKGNLLKQQSLDSNDQVISETNYQYDTKGNITRITDPKGANTLITYDTKNNPTQIKDPSNATTNIQYDANGNITQITDPNNAITKYEYNSLNKLTKITDANNQITQYQYDANGNMILMTDANAKTTAYQYNYNSQITQQTDSLNGITTYTYGSSGCPSCMGADKLTALTDAKTNTTQFTYDLIGRLTNQTDPMAKQTTYTYDTQGNLLSKTDPNGNTIQYTYDALNRLIQKTYPDASASGGTTTYQYDAIGNLTSASNAYISYTFIYDALGRMTSVSDSLGKSISYVYDANSNRTTMTSPIGTTSYVYNALNQLTQLVQGTNPPQADKLFTFAYDSLGRRTMLSISNGTTTSYSYDNLSRLTNLSTLNSQLQTINSNIYSYDSVGNKLTKQDPSGTHSYSYDNTYQLTQATHPPQAGQSNEVFAYDAVGNRTNTTVDAANKLLQDPNASYQYDNNGNRYIKTQTDGSVVYYSYDYEGRLTRVETQKPGLTTIAIYKYDPLGRRIEKAVTENSVTTTTRYLYDNEDIIAEYDANGNITTKYIHGLGIDEPLAMEKNSSIYFYHADGLGSVVALTDNAGSIVQKYEYDSFGNIVSVLNPNFIQPYTFTGREYDPETGTYHYRARTFDQKTGTFISKDPIGFAGGDVNLYRYVGNDPINWVDPEGLSKTIKCGPCTIRIESDPHKGKHAHWECRGGSSGCIKPDGSPCESSGPPPTRVRDCLKDKDFLKEPQKESQCESKSESGPTFIPIFIPPFVPSGGGVPLGSSGGCFVEGTLVHTASGLIPIDKIQIGDMVLAWNEKTSSNEYVRVVGTIVAVRKDIVKVYIDSSEPLIASSNHTFYVKGKGWGKAIEMVSGDILLDKVYREIAINKIEKVLSPDEVKVYNIEVEGLHTYYVGSSGILTHNIYGLLKDHKY